MISLVAATANVRLGFCVLKILFFTFVLHCSKKKEKNSRVSLLPHVVVDGFFFSGRWPFSLPSKAPQL